MKTGTIAPASLYDVTLDDPDRTGFPDVPLTVTGTEPNNL
jgi:hypothetical protein